MSDDRQLAARLRQTAAARYRAHLSPRIDTWSLALRDRLARDRGPAALPLENAAVAFALPSGAPAAPAGDQPVVELGRANQANSGDSLAFELLPADDPGTPPAGTRDSRDASLASPLPLMAAPEVTADLSVAETATAILLRHFASYQRRLERVADEGENADAESLRRLRIAARRLRAGLRAFSEALPPSAPALRDRFGELAGTLGTVRDLDVLAARLDQWAADLVTAARYPLELLAASISTRQATARERALAALGSSAHRELLNDFGAFLADAVEDERPFGLQPLPLVASQLVAARYWRIRRSGDLLRPDSPDADYHRLRLRVKQLRDLLEFIAPVTGTEGQVMVERLIQLQDLLGRHQDACAAAATLRDIALNDLGAATEATFLVGQLAQRFLQLADAERAEFPAAYVAIRGKAWYRLERALDRAASVN